MIVGSHMPLSQDRTLEVETPEAVTVRYPLAELGSRGMAAFIDIGMLTLLVLGEALAVSLVLFMVEKMFGALGTAVLVWAGAVLTVVTFLTYWGYYMFGEVVRNGRTLGKRLMRIRVVRDDGGRIGMLDSVIRNVVRIVDIIPGTYAVGIIASMFSSKAQRLGDMAAGTVVVAEPQPVSFLDAAAGDRRAALVGAYLERRPEMTPEGRYHVAVSLLAAYGEEPGSWDEPTIAGRLADLAGLR